MAFNGTGGVFFFLGSDGRSCGKLPKLTKNPPRRKAKDANAAPPRRTKKK